MKLLARSMTESRAWFLFVIAISMLIAAHPVDAGRRCKEEIRQAGRHNHIYLDNFSGE